MKHFKLTTSILLHLFNKINSKIATASSCMSGRTAHRSLMSIPLPSRMAIALLRSLMAISMSLSLGMLDVRIDVGLVWLHTGKSESNAAVFMGLLSRHLVALLQVAHDLRCVLARGVLGRKFVRFWRSLKLSGYEVD